MLHDFSCSSSGCWKEEKVLSVLGPLVRQGWSLFPFTAEQDGISIPRRRKVLMTLTVAASHDLGACAWCLPALSVCWDLLSPPTPPGSFLYLSVCPWLAAATLQLLLWRSRGSSWVIRPGKRRRARCKLHGGLPSLR